VIARSSMMRFKGSGKEPRIVGREVNTRYVLEGSVRRAGSSLRLTARLTDTTVGSVIWSDKMNGSTAGDVFGIQESLSRSIVGALRIVLTPDEERRLAARPIENVHAYECYLRARHEIWGFTAEGRVRAIHLLENGLTFDRETALIHATLGFAHLQGYHLGTKPDPALLHDALACARRALELEPDSAQAHAVLGAACCNSRETQLGVRELKRALALDPGSTDALFWLSWYYADAGFISHAAPLADRLAAVDPLTPISRAMPGWIALLDGRIEESLPPYETMYAMDSGNPFAKWALAPMLAWADRGAEACALFDVIVAEVPGTPFAWHGRMLSAALRGDRKQALAAVTVDLVEWARPRFQFSWFVADAYARIGERVAALDWLENAVRLGFLNYRFMSMFDVHLRALRGDPAFEAVVAEARRRHEAFEP
jgi:tetratricopeptide (TPR) repeat protein